MLDADPCAYCTRRPLQPCTHDGPNCPAITAATRTDEALAIVRANLLHDTSRAWGATGLTVLLDGVVRLNKEKGPRQVDLALSVAAVAVALALTLSDPTPEGPNGGGK